MITAEGVGARVTSNDDNTVTLKADGAGSEATSSNSIGSTATATNTGPAFTLDGGVCKLYYADSSTATATGPNSYAEITGTLTTPPVPRFPPPVARRWTTTAPQRS